MPDCFIHLGTHKTGTTSIQRFLFHNREMLRSLGFVVPSAGMDFPGSGHHHLAWELGGSDRFEQGAGWDKIAEEVRAVDGQTIVLSSEAFDRVIGAPDRRRELAERVAALGYRLRAILYLRPQEGYINATYTMRAKKLQTDSDISTYAAEALESSRFDYLSTFGILLRDEAMNADIRPFSAAMLKDGLCRDFLRALGLPEDQVARFEEPSARNISPGPKTIAAARRIRRAIGSEAPLPERRRKRLASTLKSQSERRDWNASSYFGLDADEQARIREHFRSSNDRLADEAWGRSWEDVFGEEARRGRNRNVFEYDQASPRERKEIDDMVSHVLEERTRPSWIRRATRAWERLTGRDHRT